MIRVTKGEETYHTTLTIDGQISGDNVEVIEVCCAQALSAGSRVDLFLRDVSAVDQSGQALLSRLASKGVRLLATGLYTSYLLGEIAPSSAKVALSCAAENINRKAKRQER